MKSIKPKDDLVESLHLSMRQDNMPFAVVKCPVCGYDNSHVFVRRLEPEDIDTRQGGYLIGFEFECGHSAGYVVAEHKGFCYKSGILAKPWIDEE